MSAFAIDLMNFGLAPIYRPAEGRFCKQDGCSRSLAGTHAETKYCKAHAISRKMLRTIEQAKEKREAKKAERLAARRPLTGNMIYCDHCETPTKRTTPAQKYCPPCSATAQARMDAARYQRRKAAMA